MILLCDYVKICSLATLFHHQVIINYLSTIYLKSINFRVKTLLLPTKKLVWIIFRCINEVGYQLFVIT
jgi:hypothetical protein